MLREWFEFLTLRTVPGSRRTGTLAEFISLGARLRRCGPSWAAHLERCRAFYVQAALQASSHRSCVVLGSGWIADLPLAALTEMFETVTLVDIAHPRHVRRAQATMRNLVLSLTDITGCLRDLAKHPAADALPSPFRTVLADHGWLNADLLISANILSQLGLDASERWARRQKSTPEASKTSALWQEALQRQHLHQLRQAQGHVALISDIRSRLQTAEGTTLEDIPMIPEALLPEPELRWTWLLVPPHEMGRPQRAIHTVGAWSWHG